jgi:hypothetical protein
LWNCIFVVNSKWIDGTSRNAVPEMNSIESGRQIDFSDDQANANDSIQQRFEPHSNSILSRHSHREKQYSPRIHTDFET